MMTKPKRMRGREENARVQSAGTEEIPIGAIGIEEWISAVGAIEDGIGIGKTGSGKQWGTRSFTLVIIPIVAP